MCHFHFLEVSIPSGQVQKKEAEYSPISHLASIVCPWWLDPKDVLLVMLSFALDAGGSESTAVLAVAGFGSSEADWRIFSAAWSKRLQQDGIEYFRAVDLASFRGPFKHWHKLPDAQREKLRRNLCADLMNILKRNVYRKFGCMVINKELAKLSPTLMREYSLSAYSIAGRTTEKHVREWIAQEWSRTTPVELVFEDGDLGKGKLQQRFKEDAAFTPIFKPKKDTNINGRMVYGYVPLQAGDWLAYEMALAEKHLQQGKISDLTDLRWPMQEFIRIPGEPTIYTEEDMQNFEKGVQQSKDLAVWERKVGIGRFSQGQQKR